MNNFDKEFNSKWELFLKTKNTNDLYALINHINKCFHDHLDLEPHEAIKTLPNKILIDDSSTSTQWQSEQQEKEQNVQQKELTTEEFLLAFNWPDLDHLFYFFNEELANLNRRLLTNSNNSNNNNRSTNNLVQLADSDNNNNNNSEIFMKFLSLLKCVFILSKNMICLNLIINTSLVNQFLSSYSYILNMMYENESIRDYFQFLCFLLIKAHDPYLCWFRKYFNFDPRYVKIKPLQVNNQRQFSFKFDANFFSFLFDSLKLIKDDKNGDGLTKLGIHTYACILNEISSSNPSPPASLSSNSLSNLNENLIKCIQPPIIDYLFQQLLNDNDNNTSESYMILNDKFVSIKSLKRDDANLECFDDAQLIVCRVLPHIVNILHLSLPDKRLVELGAVLDKILVAVERVKRDFIKLELVKSYLTMLSECSDRAALKVAIVSRRFFVCLLEQVRLTCLTHSSSGDEGNTDDHPKSTPFLHEFVRVVLNLIKHLLDNSQPVKDIFSECSCYELLFEILKECPSEVLDIEISMLINEMISESNSSATSLRKDKIMSSSSSYLDKLENSEMAVLLIKLLPYMKKSAQEFSLTNICRLCTSNLKNQSKSCKNSMLLNLIKLLNHHTKFNQELIDMLFRTIKLLGRYSIRQNELFELFALLQPKNRFPYGIDVLRCLNSWSKSSASIGMNLTLFEVQSATEVGLGNSTAGSGSGSNLGGFVTSGEQLDRSPTTTTSTAMLLPSSALTEYNLTDSAKLRRTSLVTINQNVLMNMMKSMGTGALSQNAQQQAKYFFDFQQHNSGIRVPSMKKWPGHAFTFHCWMKLRSDLDTYEKKRRQLYSFYTDKGEGFEAFFTADCSSLVVSVCTRKEFLSVQLRELDFDASDSTNRQQQQQQQSSPNQSPDTTTTASDGEGSNMNTTSTSDYWHSITIVHVPAKKPFGYSQVCVYIDGVLKKEADLKMPSFSDGFSQIRLGAACSRPNTGVVVGSQAQSASSYVSSTLTAPFSGLKSVFGLAYKSGANEKSLSVTTIPSGSQDTVWDAPTCLMGHLSSCFVLSDVISDLQVRLLYELGPNQYALNWLDIVEMSDIKSKMVLHYDAKCARDLTCYDLSHNRINGKFSGSTVSCDNFKESLNAIGSVQIFYPLLNYLSSNQEYLDLVLADWNANLAENNSSFTEQKMVKVNSRKSIFDDGELEKNIVSMMLNLVRHLFHNSDIMQDRFERNNGIALLGFLIQRLPRHFIDINLLRVCQDLVNEAANLSSKSLLNAIYEYLIFDFRIWNKADYEIRIGHIQYISTIIKDDRKYFRKKYGVQFFLDVIKTYFGSSASSTSTAASYKYSTSDMNQLDNQQLEDEDLRNLRSSFFGLIKYYAQKDVKVSEVNAILSFLSTTKVPQFQNDVLDVLINLLEAPSSSDQLYLLLFEPNMADAMWSLIAQMDELSEATERRLFKLIRVLLKTKKVYDKSKLRLRLDECGTFAGLTSKIAAEFSSKSLSSGDVQQQQRSAPLINENLVIELIETLMVDELHSANTNLSSSSTTNTQTQTASTTATTAVNYDNLWHILSLLTMSPVQLIANRETLIRARSKACDLVIKFFFAQHYNLSTTRALTKCPAWQDIICQMFCVERLPASILSPTTLSSQQRNAIVSNSSNPKFNAGNYDDEDVWENIEYQNETGGQASSTGAGANTSTSAAPAAAGIETTSDSMEEIIDDKLQQSTTDIDSQMTTSTPSNRRLMSNSENKHLATIHESNSNQEPVVTSTAEKPKSASSTNKSSRRVISFAEQQQQNLSSSSSSSKSASRFDLDDSMVMPIREREREASFSTAHSVKRTVSYAIDVEELGVEGAELYEKLMFILYKLVWDGVVGSNEDAWKERCQLFSSLRRLAKEFYLIKPIEQIEMRLLEMSVKYCVAEAKKTNYSYKEQSQVLENCRELIKLVDSFIDSHGDVSENLISATILLLDQIRVFDQKIPPTPQLSQQSAIANSAAQQQKLLNNTAPANYDSTSESSSSSGIKSSKLLRAFSTTSSSSSLASWSSSTSVLTLTPGDAAANNSGVTGTGGGTVPASLLSTYGIIHDEWAETSYLGMNILMNVLASRNVEICAQASAKINTILHNRTIASCEEAAYFIASVEKVIYERLNEGDEQNYAFLLPIMKCLLEKSHALLQMNVQVPNIPSFSASPSFYEDFKEYCKCDEWRIFMQKQVVPLRDQYLAMTVNPCQMNMKIWWNMCFETLMISIHKRMRSIGEAKIKFEDTLFNSWKERERLESMRYQNYLIMLKRNNLAIRKQLHTALKYLTGERGAWNEGSKEVYWMLSNHENRERMRCKLIENLKFDSHFEASRLRDHSGYPGPSYMMSSSSTAAQTAPSTATGDETAAATATPTIESSSAQNLAQKLSINKEAINAQIKEDVVGEEEFLVATPTVTTTNDSVVTSSSTSPSTATASSTSEQTQTVRSSDARSMSSNTSDSGLSRTSSLLSMNKPQQPPQPQIIAPLEPYEQFAQLEEKEKLLLKSDCELITVTRVVKGRFELTNKYIYFFDTFSPFYYEHTLNDSSSIAAGDNQPQAGYSSGGGGSGFSCQDFDILNDMKISLTQLKEVQLRRYNLRRSALEFFLVNEANFFINFNKATRNKLYGKIMSMKLPNLVSYPSVRTQVDLLKATDYTQKWVNHELSNFDYLMKLNTIAGRTYNDLSQYPIFPWILKDYTSEKLDLNDPNVYRDLSKPIGVQSKKNEDYVRAKYESFEDPTGTMRPFHYGTHYSNAANVMHYLIRLEPFTTLHIQLQSDRFDVADRQFHSIANTWRILYENPNDVKELIPEFFYLPEFLVNMNNFDFGELQMSRNKVNNVSLPRWAKSPEHFIHMHRRALESDYVSEHLHEWIDLIFGYKQQGVEAEKALNMFMYYSYEGALDLDAITDPVARRATEDMISNFGQTPTQLFKDAHPKRKSREQSIRDKIAMGKPVFLWHQINNLKAYYVEFCDPKRDNEPIDPIVFLSIPRHHTKSFMQQGLSDPLISVSQTGIVGVNGWQSNDRSLTNLFSFEKDPSLLSEKTKKSIAGPFDPNYEIDHRVFVLTHDSKLLISGAHWDNSLRVFSLSKYRTISQIYQHSNIVTCLAIDYTGSLLVSGSMDTTCMIWQVVQEYGSSVNLDTMPMHILYGHRACVTSVDICNELDLVVSAGLDGLINVHSIRSGSFVRSLSLHDTSLLLQPKSNATVTTSSSHPPQYRNLMVKLSNERHILVYACSSPSSLVENAASVANPVTSSTSATSLSGNDFQKKLIYEIFLFSINGNAICRERLNSPVQDMIIKNEHCILAVLAQSRSNTAASAANSSLNSSRIESDVSTSSSQLSSSSNSKQPSSKLVFKEMFDFKTIQTMRLKAPIKCMFLTSDEGHLLVSLQDGKLIVINGDKHIK